MNFVAALKCGTTPEVEAKRCMMMLLNNTVEGSELCPTLAVAWVNELFKAIGLQTNITVEQLQDGKGFDWEGAGCRFYIFHCNTFFFKAFERFLLHLCETTLQEQIRLDDSDIDFGPIKRLLHLLAIWCNCYTDLLEQNVDMQVQYLQEPLARINYTFFLGVHQIRKKCSGMLEQLNEICTRLLKSALEGLFFKECHEYIAESLITLIEKDFGLSDAFNEDAFKFFYQAFCLEQQKTTHSLLFKCFARMLITLPNTNTYRKFLSFVIEKCMQEIYFTILKLEKTKRLLLPALKFLNSLQEQLLDFQCFSQTFLEAILALVLHTDESISQMAAELYINMGRRKGVTDDILLKHIIEYYFEHMNSLDSLPYYVTALWPSLPYMKSLQFYFDLIADENVDLVIRYFTAQFVIVIYKKMLANMEKFAPEIVQLFQTLPTFFMRLSSQCLKGILLQLYSLTEMELISNSEGTTNKYLLDFENLFVSEIKNEINLQYPYILNLFMQFTLVIEKTKNFEKLEICGVYVYRNYEEVERALKALDKGEIPNYDLTIKYSNILQKLCALLQVKYNVLDNLEHLVRTLSLHLLYSTLIKDMANKHHIFIDIYASELLVNACIRLSFQKDLSKGMQQWLVNHIQILETFLISALSNAEIKTNAHMNRLKTYFICLVNLYCIFHSGSNIYKLPINLRPYHILIETLVISCLRRKAPSAALMKTDSEEHLELNSKYITQYQKFMFFKFTELHSCKFVTLPSPAAWKLCLHYGLKTHKFNKELLTFMEALTVHHFKIFIHISAVLVFNLYKQKPPLKMEEIQSVIRTQKLFIDQLPSALTPTLLCVNVVLQVLQFLQESLQKVPPTRGTNRLVALKHLNQFTSNINVNGDNVLPDIQSQAKALQNHILNTVEQVTLSSYLKDLGVLTKNRET